MRKRASLIIVLINIVLLMSYFIISYTIKEYKPLSWYDVVFAVDTGNQSFNIRLWHNYSNDQDYLFLPSFARQELVKGNWQVSIPVKFLKSWDGTKIIGDEFKTLDFTPGKHKFKAGNTEFDINLLCSDRVPALFIETDSKSLEHIEREKGNEEPGIYRFVDDKGVTLAEGELTKLRSRGNVTFQEDKKPYQMNLKNPADLLGSGVAKKYILLANRQDQSLIRNSVVLDIAREAGIDYTPDYRFVDLFINNDYRGSYQLCNKIDTGEYGIDINTGTKRDDTDYLISLEYSYQDRLEEEDYTFCTDAGQWVTIKRPDVPSDEQQAFIKNNFNNLQKSIISGELDPDNTDLESFAKKYIIEELSKNLDAMHASQYFYYDGTKVYAGPPWDYDKSLGNPLIENTRPVDFSEPMGIYAATVQNDASFWYDLYNIKEFKTLVSKVYSKDYLPAIDKILSREIENTVSEIWVSAGMDYYRWDTLEDQKYEREENFDTGYREQIEIVRDFLNERSVFLKEIWLENKTYDIITLDPGEGSLSVKYLDALEGRCLNKPRKPQMEGWEFDHWIREDTGEVYDFDTLYDGTPFTLKAVYKKAE